MTDIAQAGVPEISVVVPSYNCLGCLEELCRRLYGVLEPLVPSFEIVIVDDRSPDNSWPLVETLSRQFPAVRGVRLSRNFGQHLAITAGIERSRGNYVVLMDCDLQDPPERIPDLYAEIQRGYDLVLAKRIQRSHSSLRTIPAKIYFALLSKLTEEPIDGSFGTFSILSRRVADAFLRFTERDRHFMFILRWLGFNCGTIEYEHADRFEGRSSYSFLRLMKHAVQGMFFQTSVFLTWIAYLGIFFTITSFGTGAFFIYRYLVGSVLPGWTSLVVAILFSTGLILASIGVVGIYISRIFEMAKGRPMYIVDRECGCSSADLAR